MKKTVYLSKILCNCGHKEIADDEINVYPHDAKEDVVSYDLCKKCGEAAINIDDIRYTGENGMFIFTSKHTQDNLIKCKPKNEEKISFRGTINWDQVDV